MNNWVIDCPQVGNKMPTGSRLYSAMYIGRLGVLYTEGCILSREPDRKVRVQFNKFDTGMAFGWWEFEEEDFLITDELYGLYLELDSVENAMYNALTTREHLALAPHRAEILGRIKELERLHRA